MTGRLSLPRAAAHPASQPTRPSLSAVVPVYNSAASLPGLLAALDPVLAGCAPEYEIILVNDGSRDNSWAVIEQLAQAYPQVRGVDLMRNYGQHNALLCGVRRAQYEIIVTLDDDLQNPPEEIPKLLAELRAGAFDVVYGQPEAEQHGWWRDGASQITKLALASVMGVQAARSVSAFRVFRSVLRLAFAEFQGSFVNLDVLLSWGTTRFGAVAVRHAPRHAGRSNYSVTRLTVHALNMITGFSTLPLQLASLLGFAFTVLGVLVLFYVVGRYLVEGGSVPGFPFLASVIAIFAGAQLFALGIMGEYLARMHVRLMARPTYAVRGERPAEGPDDAD